MKRFFVDCNLERNSMELCCRGAVTAICLFCSLCAFSASGAVSVVYPDSMVSLVAGETEYCFFECDPGDVEKSSGDPLGRFAIVHVSKKGVVKLHADGSYDTSMSGDTVLIPMYEDVDDGRIALYSGSFFIDGLAPGEAEILVSIGDSQATVPVIVTAPDYIVFRQTSGGDPLAALTVGESDLVNSGTLYLDFGYNINQAVNFTIYNSDDGSHLLIDGTKRVAKGSRQAVVNFSPKDGPASVGLAFTGDTAYTDGVYVTVMITNAPPNIIFPEQEITITNWTFNPVDLCIQAEDGPGDVSSLLFRWYDNGEELRAYGYGEPKISLIYSEPGIHEIVCHVADKDGAVTISAPFHCTILPRPASEWGMGGPELQWKSGGDADFRLEPAERVSEN